jgi:hypothetical protein
MLRRVCRFLPEKCFSKAKIKEGFTAATFVKPSLIERGMTSMADTRDEALLEKEKALTAEIERLLPDFARSCRDSADVVIIHQDSFAADY